MNSIPYELVSRIAEELTRRCAKDVVIDDFAPASGGCINSGGRLKTSAGVFFLKWNDAKRFPGMFAAEAKGLDLLRHPGVIDIPEVILQDESDRYQFLLLKYIEQAGRVGGFSQILGEQLAKLHRVTSDQFGLDHNNYIGSLPQQNTMMASWVDFFIHQRLEPQLGLARKAGRADSKLVSEFQNLYSRLPGLLAEEPPSLLHGDLWSGNVISNDQGFPCLIDPAVYYGHRETDLAMTRLFGGVGEDFYHAYHAHYALVGGWEERLRIYQLYPLLVHLNLFGIGYLSDVKVILKYFA